MSECSLSGRGQGHVNNFCIVDLENFATASRGYTGDIHNSFVVGLFMTPVAYAGFLRRDLAIKRRLRAKKLAGKLPTTARGSEEGGEKCVATVH